MAKLTLLSRLRRFCLVPLKGDGENAKAVGRKIRLKQEEPRYLDAPFGQDVGERFAEELRTARYHDWDKERSA